MSKTMKSTGVILQKLRAVMKNSETVSKPLDAYIVPSSDAHGSEYLGDCDNRRAFISGFTGSVATAIVTADFACLWTDGRYHEQAASQLDANWTLMKDGLAGTPTQASWLTQTLPPGSLVGIDPKLYSYKLWIDLEDELSSSGISLLPIARNLVDLIWEGKPQMPNNPLLPLERTFSGKSVAQKVKDVRGVMKERNADMIVFTFLDEIAWLLNMRGSDIAFNPVFFSYVILEQNLLTIFVNKDRWTKALDRHLEEELEGGEYATAAYDDIVGVIKQKQQKGKTWISKESNYALGALVPKNRAIREQTPVQLMKAMKNAVEIRGMKNAHVKDAAALCCFYAWLEQNVATMTITELSAAGKLEEFRKLQEDYVGASFATISAVGKHGAIIHYEALEETNAALTCDSVYLCDAGAQFKDGTTDVTRSVHFGTPGDFEKECFTRVLKGQIKLATRKFPRKIRGNQLDSFAREFLWDVGLEYRHGTGHGVGAYLNVHEGPMRVGNKNEHNDPGLDEGMFISNEPGYYETGHFGIRLEDVLLIVPTQTPYNFNNIGYLAFETVTLVPKQTKMMMLEMMTTEEIRYVNAYHQQCRDIVGPLLEKQGHIDARKWLWKETEPISITN